MTCSDIVSSTLPLTRIMVLESGIEDYLHVIKPVTPALAEFVLLNYDKVIDSFVYPLENIVSYADVKQLGNFQIYRNIEEKENSTSKQYHQSGKFASELTRAGVYEKVPKEIKNIKFWRKKREKITKNIEEMRQDIVATTNTSHGGALTGKTMFLINDRVISYGILNLVTIPNKGTSFVLNGNLEQLNLLLPKIDVSRTKAITAKNIAQSITFYRTDGNLDKIWTGLERLERGTCWHWLSSFRGALFHYAWARGPQNRRRRQFRHGKNILEEEQSEGNYVVATFLYVIMWGESKMKAVKHIDDDGLDDKDRRSNSANVDGTITLRSLEIEICVIEVSRTPQVSDYTHFVEDRVKITINLKKMFRYIINKNPTGNMSELMLLNLYGMQFYGSKTTSCISNGQKRFEKYGDRVMTTEELNDENGANVDACKISQTDREQYNKIVYQNSAKFRRLQEV
ncbi:hypothetical protein INT45_012412 [Circinella minor]|uniref:Uncharacterized protein n=1 Tax=Circinella minor TaxID=1195481 RepID=A0A8H7S271_9FUNG|nr:hypothetical protein INT45_012412 [Circinella minor]